MCMCMRGVCVRLRLHKGGVKWLDVMLMQKKKKSYLTMRLISILATISGFTRVNLRGQMVLKSSKISQIKKKKGEQKQEEQSL